MAIQQLSFYFLAFKNLHIGKFKIFLFFLLKKCCNYVEIVIEYVKIFLKGCFLL